VTLSASQRSATIGFFAVFQWVLQGVRLAGKRDFNESGTQEGRELFSVISKEQDFLGRLQDELPLF
jgi:hypothetical protein